MSDHPKRDDQDPVLRRLFAEQGQALPSDDFTLKLSNRMHKRQRVRRAYRVAAIVACMAVSILSAPWVAQSTSTLIELTAAGMGTIGQHLYGPLTRLVGGATALGCLPAIYLWRTGRW
jgi:hypothetical protein